MQRYASFDNHVAVFAKIMRNEIEEGFRCVQDELLSAAAHLLRQQLQVPAGSCEAAYRAFL
eukprot:12595394-Prorocentrum_lima.AAC.1